MFVRLDMFAGSHDGYYDAILMDIKMPVLDGLEATRKIRSLDRKDAKKVAIIALTSNDVESDVNKSRSAGMNAHLGKPVDPDELYEVLEKLLK